MKVADWLVPAAILGIGLYAVSKFSTVGAKAVDGLSGAISDLYLKVTGSEPVSVRGVVIMPNGATLPADYLASIPANRKFNATLNKIEFTYAGQRYRIDEHDTQGNYHAIRIS